jgi:hypothetical protein
MPKNNSEIPRIFPKLEGLVDPKIEREIYVGFLRLYEYIDRKAIEVGDISRRETISTTQLLAEQTSQLVNNFATKLIKGNSGGGSSNNPLEELGSGTVTSINVTGGAPVFTIAGGPVTETGVITITVNTQAANKIFAGPTTGAAANPTFRDLHRNDLVPIQESGWNAWTGAGSKASKDTATVTLVEVAEAVKQIIDDLKTIKIFS